MALKRIAGPKGKKDQNAKDEKHGGTGGSLKTLVILLVVLDVLALGGFGYLRLVKRREAEKIRNGAESNLMRIKSSAETVATIAGRLSAEKAQDIKKPQELIMKAARDLQVKQYLKTQPGVTRPWPGTSYDVVTNNVRFENKEGFLFKDIIRLLRRIEDQNPKVQIKQLNFGKRDDGEDWWRPTNMQVRTFKPSSR